MNLKPTQGWVYAKREPVVTIVDENWEPKTPETDINSHIVVWNIVATDGQHIIPETGKFITAYYSWVIVDEDHSLIKIDDIVAFVLDEEDS